MKLATRILFFAMFSIAAVATRAATLAPSDETVRLPDYAVEAVRQSPAEREIARGLDEMKAQARIPLTVKVEIPLEANKGRPVLPDKAAKVAARD